MAGVTVAGLSGDEVAARAGASPDVVAELVRLGVLVPDEADEFTAGDARRIGMVRALLDAGLPLDAVATGVRDGLLSLDFADTDLYRRFATYTDETFEGLSVRTGIPLELLAVVRDAMGGGTFEPTARVREDELEVLPFLRVQLDLGFRRPAIERLLRATADSLRRVAEAEAEWFRSEVMEPRLADGRQNEIAGIDPQSGLSDSSDRALMAIHHAQGAQTWMSNIIFGFEHVLAEAGLHESTRLPPAICFLDITGYTRLTQQRGDQAAANLAEELGLLVKRRSVEHGGRPVKWLGDGVMFFFREPGQAVLAALEMIAGIPAAGLPPAHVGIHAGPVVIQEGDYYGQTVNLAARIAEYARPGEVLVSQEVVDAAAAAGIAVSFTEIGAVDLKGVNEAVRLHAARTTPPSPR